MDRPYCQNTRLPVDVDPRRFAEELANSQEGADYRCAGETGCAVFEQLGCAPKVAECRYARLIEPAHTGSVDDEPMIVQGVQCWGADLCTSSECRPQPRFSYDHM